MQQSVTAAMLRLEAAKQHRLGVEADHFPKLGATFANLHYSEFLGRVLSVRRPISLAHRQAFAGLKALMGCAATENNAGR